MDNPEKHLSSILDGEEERVRRSFSDKNLEIPLIEVVRSLDFQMLMLAQDTDIDKVEMLSGKYEFGWSLAFLLFYRDLTLRDKYPLFYPQKNTREWIDSVIQHCGSIQTCRQLLEYKKADLLSLESNKDQFVFRYLVKYPGVEQYEKMSLGFYFNQIGKLTQAKRKSIINKLPYIQEKLISIVDVHRGSFIRYEITEEIDEFYTMLAYLYLTNTQIIDDFDGDDLFGGIPYKNYLDVVEFSLKATLLHIDCCFALSQKTKYKVNPRDMLTDIFSTKIFFKNVSNYFRWENEKFSKIASCMILNKDNFEYHLNHPGAPTPPYFQIGTDIWMRSIYGCKTMPVFFINRELKRRYPEDYFSAVNKREKRFRWQLYSFFKHEGIICVDENIGIKNEYGKLVTDIDAVVFDRQRNTLGLFQLKWQDSFSNSMKERFSKISNLIPKSVEWIEKICNWIAINDAKTILNACRIKGDKIEDVYLFVISRNQMHFSNQPLDNRAIWSSWFQLIEASAKVKDPTNANPIGELAVKLNFFSPAARKLRQDVDKRKDLELKFSNHRVMVYGNQKC